MKFAIITKNQSIYRSVRTVANDIFLGTLTAVFTDELSFAKNIKDELENPHGQGRTGNEIDVDIYNSTVKISYCFSDSCIFIERQQLIQIMTKVIDLMEKEADYIVITQEHESSSVEISDKLPEGFELYIEDKELKYRYNPPKTK
ncbi:hypothetical protein Noda2021_04070 [Candidatus Dependentiae bacterium Noda2021]|nr:hypothetical protein Noda2021_04070 [Candidatus Dependentiae bacterium Noda2021]